jgi:hypothetical protein
MCGTRSIIQMRLLVDFKHIQVQSPFGPKADCIDAKWGFVTSCAWVVSVPHGR